RAVRWGGQDGAACPQQPAQCAAAVTSGNHRVRASVVATLPLGWHTVHGCLPGDDLVTRGTRAWRLGIMTLSPTVRRRRLAAELRHSRAQPQARQPQAAAHVGCTQAKIGGFETAKRSPSVGDVSGLLDFYGVCGELREQLIGLARDARKHGWWHSYHDVLPEWYETYVGLEAEASAIDTYESEAVPGVLQTGERARAITRATLMRTDEAEIARRADLRIQRQQRVHDESPVQLWAVVGEAALRRCVGGPGVLRRQLEHLLELVELSNVTVQV